jgi:hypothetical protein
MLFSGFKILQRRSIYENIKFLVCKQFMNMKIQKK